MDLDKERITIGEAKTDSLTSKLGADIWSEWIFFFTSSRCPCSSPSPQCHSSLCLPGVLQTGVSVASWVKREASSPARSIYISGAHSEHCITSSLFTIYLFILLYALLDYKYELINRLLLIFLRSFLPILTGFFIYTFVSGL